MTKIWTRGKDIGSQPHQPQVEVFTLHKIAKNLIMAQGPVMGNESTYVAEGKISFHYTKDGEKELHPLKGSGLESNPNTFAIMIKAL